MAISRIFSDELGGVRSPLNKLAESTWHDPEVAKAYDSFVEEYPMYWVIGRWLIGTALLERPLGILDLACGTGVISRILRRDYLYADEIIATDTSSPILGFAARRCEDLGVRIVLASGDPRELTTIMGDLVVCSAAVWQLSFEKTLESLAAGAVGRRQFIYNYPAGVKFCSLKEQANIGRQFGWEVHSVQRMHYLASADEASSYSLIPIFGLTRAIRASAQCVQWTRVVLTVGTDRKLTTGRQIAPLICNG